MKLKEGLVNNKTMCEVCRSYPCSNHCPNYIEPKTQYYCSVCGEGIFKGDKYLKNEDGELRHYDCFYSTNELVEWLGYKIKTMGDDYGEDY